MTDLVRRAELFATAAHGATGQKRKYTAGDYIVHPRAVAATLRAIGADEWTIAAGWLHDVLEDTAITYDVLHDAFGYAVARLVQEVTDVSRPEDGNRAARKALDCAHIASASRDAKTIKLADLIDNSASILERDPGFAETYLKEKRALMEVLREGDRRLWTHAAAQIGGFKLPSLRA